MATTIVRRGSCLVGVLGGMLVGGASCNGSGDDGSVWDSVGMSTGTTSGTAEGPSPDSTAASASGSGDATTAGVDGGSSGDGPKLDVGPPGGGGIGCGCELSYIWVSNSPAGTVSKINTETMTKRCAAIKGNVEQLPIQFAEPEPTRIGAAWDAYKAHRAHSRIDGIRHAWRALRSEK